MVDISSGFEITSQLRALLPEMVKRAPSDLSTDGDVVPGDDLRNKGNAWLRSSFNHSGLRRAPREGQLRTILTKLVKQKKLGFSAEMICFGNTTTILWIILNLWVYHQYCTTQTNRSTNTKCFSSKDDTSLTLHGKNGYGNRPNTKQFLNIFESFIDVILGIFGASLTEPSRHSNATMYCWSIRRAHAGAGILHLLANPNPVGFLATYPFEIHHPKDTQTQNISVRVGYNYHSPGLLWISWRRNQLTMMVRFQLLMTMTCLWVWTNDLLSCWMLFLCMQITLFASITLPCLHCASGIGISCFYIF